MASNDPSATRVLPLAENVEVITVRRAIVEVLSGRDQGSRLDLGERSSAVIGTDPDADLVLHDDSVSWRHAELRVGSDGYVLADLGSTNGLRIGGVRVPRCTLTGETLVVSLGETDVKIRILEEEVRHPLSARSSFGSVLGRSPAMRQMFAVLEKAAATNSTVLLEGESGTGKEVIAEGIHRASACKKGPFVVIDCSTIPPTLIESELFGYEKGAFTGADESRAGAIEEASGGTLFLDEIGELPPDMQPKFLRALERRQVKRIGSSDYRDIKVHVIGATHRDLSRMVNEGRFRADLYYRLAVVRVCIPSLRQRKEDIALLARNFCQQMRPDRDPGTILTGSVLAAFSNYDWPGNVRELRNAVERLLALGELGLALNQKDSAPSPTPTGDYQHARRDAIEQFEEQYCRIMLSESGGVVARAAERAGISRQMFHRLLQRHGIHNDE